MKKKTITRILAGSLLFFCLTPTLQAQTEVMAWGNMTGIRVDGQLMDFESSIRVVKKDFTYINATGKERQNRPQYIRDGQSQIVKTTIDKITFDQTVTDVAKSKNTVLLTMKSDTMLSSLEGIFLAFDIPDKYFANGTLTVGGSSIQLNKATNTWRKSGKSIVLKGDKREYTFSFNSNNTVFVRKELADQHTIYIQIAGSRVKKGQTAKLNYTIEATGEIENAPVNVRIEANKPGRLFDGLGGNFRLQNPRVDPQVIDYCLNNLRVAWGRVEMPWRNWQPDENMDPIAEARAGRLNERVEAAMKMAQRLKAMGMPVIVSAWFPPIWAIDGDPSKYVRRGGVQAFKLDPNKQQKIYKSLTDYLVYLKEEYGVEAIMYSFNESDLGIDVLHSPEEHRDFIKGLGAYMASRGLATKMLLGDNSDATTFDFILPAMKDKEAHKYIGAVSYHSWRGCDNETLKKWSAASKELNVPMIIGEGSTDAAAHVYPQIFAESTFALYEINLYTRICAITEPQSILQWQLTSDYSILWGDGVYGSNGPLRPTQRFWNLKQLADTPEGSFSLPFTADNESVNCAAFGNISRGEYTLHMVNNGAARQAVITGFPATTSKNVEVYVTNSEQGREQIKDVRVENGNIIADLPPASFISVYMK